MIIIIQSFSRHTIFPYYCLSARILLTKLIKGSGEVPSGCKKLDFSSFSLFLSFVFGSSIFFQVNKMQNFKKNYFVVQEFQESGIQGIQKREGWIVL